MKSIFLFPGYASQFVGMGKELYDDNRIVQEYFEQASQCLDINFVKLCFASSDIELGKMAHAYPSIFLVSSSLFALLKESGINPDAVAGFNQGEYAALYATGSMSFPDGLYLLSKYATFYEELLDETDVAAMHVRGVNADTLEKICKKESVKTSFATIALYQTAIDHVVTGHADAVDKVRKKLLDIENVKIDDVGIEVGLHSDIMQPMADQFKMYMEKADFKDASIPFFAGSTGKTLVDGEPIKQYIQSHVQLPVQWPKIMQLCKEYDVIVQVGPGNQLSSWLKELYPDKKIVAINKQSDIDKLKEIMNISGE